MMQISRIAFLISLTTAGISAAPPSVDLWNLQSGLSFEPNRGQIDQRVRYFAHTGSGIVLFTNREIVLQGSSGALRFELRGADSGATWQPADLTGATTSYHVGRDARKWTDDVPHYRRLTLSQVYPGIDVVYYGNGNHLEYDFLLAPHADPSRIRIRANGARTISIANDGTLVVDTPWGQVIEHKPVLYQLLTDGSKKTVDGAFRLLSKNEVGFTVARYNHNISLSIDPVLEGSTYFGGNSDDKVVAADGLGNVVGTTTSLDVPGAAFARRKGTDIFVRIGSQTLIFGGSGDDKVTSVDFGVPSYYTATTSILVGGYTDSRDLPTTGFTDTRTLQPIVPWQQDYAGGATDGFILMVQTNSNNNFGPYIFISYVGSSGDDRVTAVANQISTQGIFEFAGTTTGSDLPTPPFPAGPPFQAAPAGGLDGFFMVAYLSFSPYIYASTYLGGSGDDTPLSIIAASTSSTSTTPSSPAYYVAGETKSPDFPLVNPIYSQLSGDSDAFLSKITNTGGVLTLTASTLFGGSGVDRGVQLAQSSPYYSNGNVLLAGTTSSTDLPVSNAVQSVYGGGPSDAFFAQFTPDLTQVVSCTYFGGSGADEATSIATDSIGNVFLAGWTSSTDFPVNNAIQSTYGGGPDDGFLIHFVPDGSLQQATYFGGSKSDRILNISALGGPDVWLAGQTTSPDLPLQNSAQSALRGTSDGFIAHISANILQISQAAAGKDTRVGVAIWSGNTAAGATTQLTVTSSDPSKVQVATNSSDPGQASVQEVLRGSDSYFNSGVQYVYMDCLDDHGGADLTFSAPGYADKTVHATCLETHINPSLYPTPLQLSSPPSTISYYLIASDPNNPALVVYAYALRPGASPITVQVSNTNPSVGTLSDTSFTITSGQNQGTNAIVFTPTGVGQTELVFTSASLKPGPNDRLKVSVGPPVQFGSRQLPIPMGFQSFLSLSYGARIDPAAKITITSQDPSSLVLSNDGTQPGTASITAQSLRGFYAQALAPSGDIPVTISTAGVADVTTTVHLTTPIARLNLNVNQLSLNVGQSSFIGVSLGAAGSPPVFVNYGLNPGSAPLQFGLSSSNQSVLSVPTSAVQVNPSSGIPSFQIQAIAEGSANITLQPPDGIPLFNNAVIPVKVTNKSVRFDDIEVGKDLIGTMTLILPLPATSAASVKVTSSNPALALLSPDRQSAGQPQISLPIGAGAKALSFSVYGLAASGQAKVTADVPGFGAVTATVQLDPSGFGWAQERYSNVLYNQNASSATINSFVLDPATLIPVGAQSLRPGIATSVAIASLNPDIAISNSSVLFGGSNGSAAVGISSRASGTATLQITQQPGFTTPAIRQQLLVTISTPTIQLSSTVVGKDTQGRLDFSTTPVITYPLTITSSDPSKLVISTDQSVPGSGSITIPAGQNRPQIFLQALDSQGLVTVTASEPTYTDGRATVTLAPLMVGMSVEGSGFINGSIAVKGNVYSTTTQSPNTGIRLSLLTVAPYGGFTNAIILRPGAVPPQVEVRSSNTTVGRIVGNPVRVVEVNNSTSVDFQPVGLGQTDVSVVPPLGFADSSVLTFNVTGPGFTTHNIVMGKDTAISPGFDLLSNVLAPTINATVTITSTDPSRVLLSRDANSAPVASMTSTLIAGQRSFSGVMIHAFANNGIVPIKITAPGYTDSSFNVALTDLLFSFGQPYGFSGNIRSLLQAGPQTMQVSATVVFPKGLPSDYGAYGTIIRPGAANIPITVVSSDPGIVAIDNPQLLFTAGSSSQAFTYRPAAAGLSTLSLNTPDGYLPHPTQGSVAITVDRAKLSIGLSPSLQIGRDLQINGSFGADTPFRQPTLITVASSDPSRLLVSSDANTPGQGTISLTATPGSQPQIFLQSLSDNGSASITVSSDGYQSGSLTVALVPSAAVFQPGSTTQNIYTNSGVQQMPVSIGPLDPSTLRPSYGQSPRAGANLSVTVSSSDSKVVSVNTPTIQFSVGTQVYAQLQPRGIGTAIVSLGLLPGGVTAASGQQLVFNVAEPDLFIPDFSLGRDLQVPVTAALASRLPAPTSNTTINICEYGGVGLSSDPKLAPQPGQCISAIIPAGQHVSTPFYVQAFSDSGRNEMSVSSPGYMSSTSFVSLTQTAFIFREASLAQPISITRGSGATFTVVPSMLPLSLTSIAPLAIRAGTPPIKVNVVSSDPKIVTVTNSPITFNPGDQQAVITVQAVAPGTATVTLSGATYQFGTGQSSVVLQVK